MVCWMRVCGSAGADVSGRKPGSSVANNSRKIECSLTAYLPAFLTMASIAQSMPALLPFLLPLFGCKREKVESLRDNKRYDCTCTSAATRAEVAPRSAAGGAGDGTQGGLQSDHVGYV